MSIVIQFPMWTMLVYLRTLLKLDETSWAGVKIFEISNARKKNETDGS